MDREKFVDITILTIIAALGLFTAFLTFGILNSQASAQIQQYSVSGAIAGALVSWSVLGTLYRQFRQSSDAVHRLQENNRKLQELLEQGDQVKSLQENNKRLQELLERGDEIKELRKRAEELQQKLIRGAPKPEGYEIEISDREKIVLARPTQWLPREAIIFAFELPDSAMTDKRDVFPAQFRVSYVHIDESTGTADEYYSDYERYYSNFDRNTMEYIDVGGEPNPIRSLKIMTPEYCRIEISENRKTKMRQFTWSWATQEQYEEAQKAAQTPPPVVPPPGSPEAAEVVPPAAPPEPPKAAEPPPTSTTEAPAASAVTDAAAGLSTLDVTSMDGDPQTLVTPPQAFYERLIHMSVVCYHKSLGTIYFFDFWDDTYDFTQMSKQFNQILRSTRFLT